MLERAVPGLTLLTPEEATFVSNVKKLRVSVERGIKLLWQRSITSGGTSSGSMTSSLRRRSSSSSSDAGALSARAVNATGIGRGNDDWRVGTSSSSGTSSSNRSTSTATTSKRRSTYDSRASQSKPSRSRSRGSSTYSPRELSNAQLGFVADKTQSSARIVFELMKSGRLWDTVLPAAVCCNRLSFYRITSRTNTLGAFQTTGLMWRIT